MKWGGSVQGGHADDDSSEQQSHSEDEHGGAINVDDQGEGAKAEANATPLGSFFNLYNSIVGAGVLAVPYALKLSGLIPGLICVLIVYVLSSYSFQVLARLSHETKQFSYKGISIWTWGTWMAYIGEISILLYTYLSLVARPIIIGDFMTDVFKNWLSDDNILCQYWFIVIIVSAVFLFPLSCLQKIDSLKWASLVSLGCVSYSVVIVVYRFFDRSDLSDLIKNVKLFNWGIEMFMTFGILIVSFCAHYNLPTIYEELRNRNLVKMNAVIYSSTTACLAFYMTMGLAGFFTFGDDTKDNVLNNYKRDDYYILCARITLSVALTLSYPLITHPCRATINNLFFSHKPFSWIRSILITLLLVASSSGIAIALPEINIIFGYTGACFGTIFVFILPGLFYLRLRKREDYENPQAATYTSYRAKDYPTSSVGGPDYEQALDPLVGGPPPPVSLWYIIGGWVLILGGILMGIAGTIGSTVNVIQDP